MDEAQSLNHARWECKYHVVFILKGRCKVLYTQLRRVLGEVFRTLAQHKESRIEEGHLMPDRVHMLISIPPKYAVSQVVGYIKGTSAIHLARTYGEQKRNFTGQHFWARGYYVSTVGKDEAFIRACIPSLYPPSEGRESPNGSDEVELLIPICRLQAAQNLGPR